MAAWPLLSAPTATVAIASRPARRAARGLRRPSFEGWRHLGAFQPPARPLALALPVDRARPRHFAWRPPRLRSHPCLLCCRWPTLVAKPPLLRRLRHAADTARVPCLLRRTPERPSPSAQGARPVHRRQGHRPYEHFILTNPLSLTAKTSALTGKTTSPPASPRCREAGVPVRMEVHGHLSSQAAQASGVAAAPGIRRDLVVALPPSRQERSADVKTMPFCPPKTPARPQDLHRHGPYKCVTHAHRIDATAAGLPRQTAPSHRILLLRRRRASLAMAVSSA